MLLVVTSIGFNGVPRPSSAFFLWQLSRHAVPLLTRRATKLDKLENMGEMNEHHGEEI